MRMLITLNSELNCHFQQDQTKTSALIQTYLNLLCLYFDISLVNFVFFNALLKFCWCTSKENDNFQFDFFFPCTPIPFKIIYLIDLSVS